MFVMVVVAVMMVGGVGAVVESVCVLLGIDLERRLSKLLGGGTKRETVT